MTQQRYKKPGQLKTYLALTWYIFRAQTRNPATFFFGFIFPIVFISIFGLIGGGGNEITLGLQKGENTQNAVIQAMKATNIITLKEDSKEALHKQLTQGKIAGIISVEEKNNPQNPYTVSLMVSNGNPQQAAQAQGLLGGIIDKTNLSLSGVQNPPVTLSVSEVSGRKSRYIDFALPGQLGFSMLATAIFGTVFGLIYLKKSLVLKRMFATPTKAFTILLAQGTSRLIVAMLQTMLILIVGVFVFKFYLPHGIITFLELLVLSAFGLIAFLGFGYFIAGLTNDENAANPLTNLVTLPQFLLSGTFFPTDVLPSWAQPIANNLPLSYFNIAVRRITTEGGSFSETLPYMAGLLLWGAVMYILASRTFKWQ